MGNVKVRLQLADHPAETVGVKDRLGLEGVAERGKQLHDSPDLAERLMAAHLGPSHQELVPDDLGLVDVLRRGSGGGDRDGIFE